MKKKIYNKRLITCPRYYSMNLFSQISGILKSWKFKLPAKKHKNTI